MNQLITFIQKFFRFFIVWFIVDPWSQSIRVRLGKYVTLFGPGLHFKIPFIDVIYTQSIRMRICDLKRQTLTSQDGKTVTLDASIGYSIVDIKKLYDTLFHPEQTINGLAKVAIAQYIATHIMEENKPMEIVEHLNKTLDFSQYGLGEIRTFITNFAVVRTFRFIGDNDSYNSGSKLSTDNGTKSCEDYD